MKIEDVDDEGIIMLRDLQAIKELKRAYRKRDMHEASILEKWFRGEQFNVLTQGSIDPEKIIEYAMDNRKSYKRHYARKEGS